MSLERLVDCRLCGAIHEWRAIESIQEPFTNLYQCPTCSGQFWWPVVNPGADWYEQTYAGRNDDPVQHLGWNHYQFLNNSITPGTLLDIGCGIGHLLSAARAKGWQVWGLDFDENAVRAAHEQYSIDTVAKQNMEQFTVANPGRQFTVVTAFEVLEHMDDPRRFISDMYALIQPNGYAAISVPYRNAPLWIRPNDFPPGHLTRWNRTAMTNFLTNHNFEVIRLRRGAVTVERLLMRFKFAAGWLGSVGMINRAKEKISKSSTPTALVAKLRLLRRVARLKDWVFFGLPAVTYWLCLWITRQHYTALYVLARKKI